MNVFIRIEVLGRELQGRLLLALAAAERGHTAVLLDNGTAFELSDDPRGLPAGYFHDNSPGQEGGKTVLHEDLGSRGWLITGQDEEHGLATDDFDRDMGGRFPPRPMANKAAMFAFGPYDAAGIRRASPDHAHRVHATGSPRVDFWRSDLAEYFCSVRPDGIQDFDDYLLFLVSNSPFFAEGPRVSFANAAGSRSELMRRVDLIADGDLAPSMIAAYRRVVDTKLAVEAIARRHPNLAVVYRPHPHELLDAWEEVLADAPANVRVLRDNAISPWVRHARCVVAGGSTVGFEAAFAGVPLISFDSDGYDGTTAASRMGHHVTSTDELLPLVDAILAGDEPPLSSERAAAMQETLESRFCAMDGRLAADRIVDVWEELATEEVLGAPAVTVRDLGRPPTPRMFARRVRDAAVIGLGLEDASRRADRLANRALLELKFPPFDMAEVLRIHRGLTTALGRFDGIRVTQVRPRVLHIARG